MKFLFCIFSESRLKLPRSPSTYIEVVRSPPNAGMLKRFRRLNTLSMRFLQSAL